MSQEEQRVLWIAIGSDEASRSRSQECLSEVTGARPTARCDYSPIRERRMPFDDVRRQSFPKGLTFVQLWCETVKDDSTLVAVAAQNQVLFGRSASDQDLHNLVRKPWEMEPDLDADRFQEEAKRNCFRDR